MQDTLEEAQKIFSNGKINSKREFYILYNNNLLGNKPLCWDTHKDLLASNWRNPVCIRSTKGTARSNTRFNVPFNELEKELEDLKQTGVKDSEMSFNQSMPDEHLLIQGEVKRTEQGVYLLYSTIKKPMNLAFKEEVKHAFGLKATMIMQTFLFPQSYDDVMDFLSSFPESIIEFGAYAVSVGNLKGRNTIIWEVRNY
ncbi:MAG: hypothetical protein WCW44_01175 [archaeon]|jgi:hypothetical protein